MSAPDTATRSSVDAYASATVANARAAANRADVRIELSSVRVAAATLAAVAEVVGVQPADLLPAPGRQGEALKRAAGDLRTSGHRLAKLARLLGDLNAARAFDKGALAARAASPEALAAAAHEWRHALGLLVKRLEP